MLELVDTLRAWGRDGVRAALATLIDVQGSAPRDPGAVFAVGSDGRLAGSISGGCVEAALVEEAQAVLRDAHARVVSYGLSDADAQAVGLTCGGRLRVLVEPVDMALCERIVARRDELLGFAVRIDERLPGARAAVFAHDVDGTLGGAELDAAVAAEMRESAAARAHVRTYGEAGEPHGGIEIFLERIVPAPEMYVFGAIDFAAAMVRIGKLIGYRVTLCDARPAFATQRRFPEADRVVVAWPHEFLAAAPVDERTAIVVLTHDEKFDVPLLRAALRTRAAYVGAMGSRRTHARRAEQLRTEGVSESELARLSAPVGLDIGARTPEETAIAIAAEIVALRNGRTGGRLTGGAGSVRGSVAALP